MSHRLPIFYFFFFNDTATTEIYTLSLHDALPISLEGPAGTADPAGLPASAVRDHAPAHAGHRRGPARGPGQQGLGGLLRPGPLRRARPRDKGPARARRCPAADAQQPGRDALGPAH